MPRPSLRPRALVACCAVTLAVAGCGAGSDAAAPAPAVLGSAASSAPATTAPSPEAADIDPVPTDTAAWEGLEEEFDARLGLYALDTATGREVVWRADERFAHASTIKAPLAAAALDLLKVTGLRSEVRVAYSDVLDHAPVTGPRAGRTMPLGDVIEASLVEGDNTAANILLEVVGGPDGLEETLAAVGDETTDVSRPEPALADWDPDEERDTSTPRALATTLASYTVGEALDAPERDRLMAWLAASRTGDTLIRAGLPGGWQAATRSGTGSHGVRNDIGVVWPEGGDPVVLAVLSHRVDAGDEADDRLVAQAAGAALSALGRAD